MSKAKKTQDLRNLAIFLASEFGPQKQGESICEMAIRVLSAQKQRLMELGGEKTPEPGYGPGRPKCWSAEGSPRCTRSICSECFGCNSNPIGSAT